MKLLKLCKFEMDKKQGLLERFFPKPNQSLTQPGKERSTSYVGNIAAMLATIDSDCEDDSLMSYTESKYLEFVHSFPQKIKIH
jgi:hypothetical protein